MEQPLLLEISQAAPPKGIFFNIIKYNGASLRPMIPRIILKTVCNTKRTLCKKEHCSKHAKDTHAIYVDDLSEAEAVELKKQLVKDPVQRPFPLSYHEHTQHVFPSDASFLQKTLQTQIK